MGEVELPVADKAFGAKLVWVVVHFKVVCTCPAYTHVSFDRF